MSMQAPLLADPSGPEHVVERRRRTSSVGTMNSYETIFPPICFVPSGLTVFMIFLFGLLMTLCLTVWKELLEEHGLSSEDLIKYVSIPVVSTIFTYCHIWAALYMTFYPLRYMGCLQIPDTNVGCGWQGIVPNRAEFMAKVAVQNILKVMPLREILERLDPDIVVDELGPVLRGLITEIMHTIAMEEVPEVWKSLSNMVKNELIEKVREDTPVVCATMLTDVKDNIESLLDLEEVVARALVRDPGLLCHMFIVTGYKELEFIRNFGATMGLIFGMIQVALWIFYSAGWMLPAFGFVVGMGTNWIALKMIFEPVDPVPLFGGRLVIQGLFLKRQAEAGAEFSKIVADNLLSSRNLIQFIITGSSSDKLFDLIRRHINETCDKEAGIFKPFIKGRGTFERCKKSIGESLIKSLSETMRHAEKYMDSTMDLEHILAEKMAAMPAVDFEQMLHPVFQQDEWKLVLLGGFLGVVIGCCQWWALGS